MLERFESLEEVYERSRIVARLIDILQAQEIGFRFEQARKFRESDRGGEMGGLPYGITNLATYEDQNKTAVIHDCGTRGLTSGMSRGNMRDLMGHGSG